ncbi:MAG: LptF/LptG family permease, partial [Rhizobiales bacterium]|nr:LptF/LptG family permease [Hyphomicrobiales bacterium]
MAALPRVFGLYVMRRLITTIAGVFLGVFVLVVTIDYIELTRRASNMGDFPAWFIALTSLYRVPQIIERLLPFAVLVATMMVFLNLSRRNELVIARAAGMSAWQFVAPAVLAAMLVGIVAATVYNPIATLTSEEAKRNEATIFGAAASR